MEVTDEMRLGFIKQMIARLSNRSRIGLTAEQLEDLDTRLSKLCGTYRKLKELLCKQEKQ